MFKKIVEFFKSTFKSTPISTSTVVESVEIEKNLPVIDEPTEKKKRSKKKSKEETTTNVE